MSSYPVRVDARLDEPLSRWLWLVKWLLVIPHYVVLFFLWIAYVVLTVVAFFAILFTGRYPRAIFDFNVGVLRWTWRVSYYSYSGLGTDRYPPFTLAEVPDYPATLQIDYPERLSRGLVLVKWWLLAIPHYLVVGVFVGAAYTSDDSNVQYSLPSLVGLLVFFAGVMLLFAGRYPRGIYDLAVGLNRWALRVAAYASLMTDQYPPFRLDQGGDDPANPTTPPPGGPAGTAAWPEPAAASVGMATAATAAGDPTAAGPAAPVGGSGAARPPMGGPGAARAPMAAAPMGSPPVRTTAAGRWTAGRVVAVVLSALLVAIGVGAASAGGVIAWADGTQRDAAGYLSMPMQRYTTTSGYGMRFETLEIRSWPRDAELGRWLGTVRVHAQDRQGGAVFVGIADSRDVAAYCGGPGMMGDYWDGGRRMPGVVMTVPPRTAPTDQSFWVASATGPGAQSLTWEPTDGTWTVVVMNADAGRGVDVDVTAGATVPALRSIGLGLLIGGGLTVLAGAVLIVLAVTSGSAARRPAGTG